MVSLTLSDTRCSRCSQTMSKLPDEMSEVEQHPPLSLSLESPHPLLELSETATHTQFMSNQNEKINHCLILMRLTCSLSCSI